MLLEYFCGGERKTISIFCRKACVTLGAQIFNLLFCCSVGQSRVMYFIALPQKKKLSSKSECNAFSSFFFVCKLISQNEWMFSFLWINVFNVFASRPLLID